MRTLARKYVCAHVYYYSIIKPLCGPTCMLKTSKISKQVEIASWVAIIAAQEYTPFGQNSIFLHVVLCKRPLFTYIIEFKNKNIGPKAVR